MKRRDRNKKHTGGKLLVGVVAIHCALAITYWLCSPFGAPPDEVAHARYVQSIAANRSLPIFHPQDRERYEFHQPPLYYLMAQPFYLWTKAFGSNLPESGVRLLSLLLGVLVILIAYHTVRIGFPNEPELAAGTALFIGFLPMQVMLSSSVSNDSLTELVFSLAILLVTTMLTHGLSWQTTVRIGLVMGLGLLTKATCLLLFPITALAYAIAWKKKKQRLHFIAVHFVVILGISFIVGGWWLYRNHLLYGDALGISYFQKAFTWTAKPDFWLAHGLSWTSYLGIVAAWTFASFWGVFGQMSIFMPCWVYCALAVVSAIVKYHAWREIVRRAVSSHMRSMLIVYATAVMLIALALLRLNLTFFQAQGRYLSPVLIPMSIFWALGVSRIAGTRRNQFVPILCAVAPAGAQLAALITCILPGIPHS